MMADKLDVLTRIGLERSIEAIVDAGNNLTLLFKLLVTYSFV